MKRTFEMKRQQGKKECIMRKYNRSVDAFLYYLDVRDVPIDQTHRRIVVKLSIERQAQYLGKTLGKFLSCLRDGVDELIISHITGNSRDGVGRKKASRTYYHGSRLRQMQDAIESLERGIWKARIPLPSYHPESTKGGDQLNSDERFVWLLWLHRKRCI